MRVCIVTVYNSENCGSYWQSFALNSYLKREGCDVSFLKRNVRGTSHSLLYVGSRTLKWLLKGKIKNARAQIGQYFAFCKAIKTFDVVKYTAGFDLCIIGSDTLWNLEDKYFEDNRANFFGEQSKAKKTITYAISAANTPISLFQSHPELRRDIINLDAVSVRDGFTYSIVKQMAGIHAPFVVDPTLLLNKDEYRKYCIELKIDNFLFIYYFGTIPTELQEQIRLYAKLNNLKIVVMGQGMNGDYNFDVFSPFVFVSCFNNAEYVVTNTFHGVMFTLIFEKEALFNSCGKEKVKDVLKEYGLQDKDYSCNSLSDCMIGNIDYNYVRARIEQNRLAAKGYLEKYIGGTGK